MRGGRRVCVCPRDARAYAQGGTAKFDVDPQSTVLQLKEKIQAADGTPIDRCHIMAAGKLLENSRKLCEYPISSGDTVYTVLCRLRGEWPPGT